ncbi:Annexin, partial [Coprinellus micaceus]
WYLGVQIPDPNLPKAGLGLEKVPGFHPKEVWEALENLVESFTVTKDEVDEEYEAADPVKVCHLLLGLTVFQRDALNDYAKSSGVDSLYHWIHNVETIRGLAEGPLAYDVYVLHATLEGKMGELTLVELICDREEEDLQLLMSEYQKQHDISLVNAIRKKYSGRKLENLLLSVLILQRQHDDLPVDEIRVDNDVIALRNAIEEQDDKTLTELLTKRSKPHIAAIITKYAAAHGSLRKHIKQRWNAKGLLYIIDGAKSKRDGEGAWRDAKLLEETMKGLGTQDDKLRYRVIRAHWNTKRFSAVKQAYQERYEKDLDKRIDGDTSGNYREILQLIYQAGK